MIFFSDYDSKGFGPVLAHQRVSSGVGTVLSLKSKGHYWGELEKNLTRELKGKWEDSNKGKPPGGLPFKGVGWSRKMHTFSCVALQAPGQASPGGLPRLLHHHQDARLEGGG